MAENFGEINGITFAFVYPVSGGYSGLFLAEPVNADIKYKTLSTDFKRFIDGLVQKTGATHEEVLNVILQQKTFEGHIPDGYGN